MTNNNSRIYDCHLHFGQEFEDYGIDVYGANVIFNSLEDYYTYRDKVGNDWCISLIFDFRSEIQEIIKIVSSDLRIRAVKIHSRIQKIQSEDYTQIIDGLKLLDSKIHLIYDAFYYGGQIDCQPSIEGLIDVINSNPERIVIVAHSGGHRAMDYLLHLKGFKNVYFDLSFSLVYLKGSSAYMDLVHLIKYIPKNRLLFGTDYPNISAKKQLDNTMEILNTLDISVEDRDRILFNNAYELFGS